MAPGPTLAFRGTLVHTPQYGQVDMLLDKLLIVKDGQIAHIGEGSQEIEVLQKYGLDGQSVHRLQVMCDVPIQCVMRGMLPNPLSP